MVFRFTKIIIFQKPIKIKNKSWSQSTPNHVLTTFGKKLRLFFFRGKYFSERVVPGGGPQGNGAPVPGDRGVLRTGALHRYADQALLVGHVHAARIFHRAGGEAGHFADRRGAGGG